MRRRLLWMASLLLLAGCPGVTPSPSAQQWNTVRVDNNPSVLPVAVVVFDMDSDGALDVVSVWRGSPVGGGSRVAAVVIHFQLTPTSWETVVIDENARYAEANGLTVADIDLDGDPDIVVAAQTSIVYLNAPANPRLTNQWDVFPLAASINDEFKAWFDVAAGQIDGDFGLDIAAALNDDGRVVWFRSPQDPNSAAGWQRIDIDATTRSQADSVLLLDLDSDGQLDVISTAANETTAAVSWYEQPDDPVLDDWTKNRMSDFSGATRFAMGDLDNDQKVDLAAISPADKRVAWLPQPVNIRNQWSGWELANFDSSLDGRVPVDIAIADMDNNGQNDVIVVTADPSTISYFTPTSDNRFHWTEQRIYSLAEADFALIDVADFDEDNDIDVAVPMQDQRTDTVDRVEWLINPTNGGVAGGS